MLGRPVAVAAVLFVAGCASAPDGSRDWTAIQSKDPFSDQTTCRVTPTARVLNALIRPYSIGFYPLVEGRSDGVRVGLISGGIKVPAGRVQIRIDANEAWTIETSETPVDSEAVNTRSITEAAMPPSLDPKLRESMRVASATSSLAINQIVSPYTVTTGDKARAIIDQMRQGHQAIYRQIGTNAPNSTTGQISLGADFNAALAACGI